MKRYHIIANQLLTLFRDCGIVIVPRISGIRNANSAIVSDFFGQFSQIVFGALIIITWLKPFWNANTVDRPNCSKPFKITVSAINTGGSLGNTLCNLHPFGLEFPFQLGLSL